MVKAITRITGAAHVLHLDDVVDGVQTYRDETTKTTSSGKKRKASETEEDDEHEEGLPKGSSSVRWHGFIGNGQSLIEGPWESSV